MKSVIIYIAISISALVTSCTNGKSELLIEENIKAVGNISKDSIFNGAINFYTINSGKLTAQYNYVNGKKEGKAIEYNSNGTTAAILNFTDDKLNGYSSFFDTNGKLLHKYFNFYGLRVGPSIKYDKGQIVSYNFYSFQNDILLQVDNKNLKQNINPKSNFFFYFLQDYSELKPEGLSSKKEKCFLFTPNPPGYNFRYSLVLVDSAYNVVKKLQSFDQNSPWAQFSIPLSYETERPVIMLEFKYLSNQNFTLFKDIN